MRLRSCITTQIVGLLFITTLHAQAPRRRSVTPSPDPPLADSQIIALALPPSASHIISTVRCTLVDTRNPNGAFGGPRMVADVARSFLVPAGPCPGIPDALGYALVFTAIAPDANTVQIKAWATGAAVPGTATLILNKGTAADPNNTASRAAAIEASALGSVDVQTDVGTDLVIELQSYYTAGLVISVNAGNGLFGGGTGNTTLGIAPFGVGMNELAPNSVTVDKINVSGSGAGQVMVSDGSSASWRTPPQGTITGVTAGSGLTGGGTSGTVSLAADFTASGGMNGTATAVARGDHRHYLQTVIVNPAATATDSGTALYNAVAGITDATAAKPYLVKIEPGIYDLGTLILNMKPYVSLEGSGELATTITSAADNSLSGTVNTADNSELSDMTVVSTGGASYSIALSVKANTTFLGHDVTVTATGASPQIYGVKLNSGAVATFRNLTINASGSETFAVISSASTSSLFIESGTIDSSGTSVATGIYSAGKVDLNNVRISISGASLGADGVLDNFTTSDSSIKNCAISLNVTGQAEGMNLANVFSLTDIEVSVANTSNSSTYGLRLNNGTGTVKNSAFSVSSTGGTTNTTGIYLQGSTGSHSLWIESSQITAGWAGITNTSTSTTVRVAGSRMQATNSVLGAGTTTCAGVWNATSFFATTCP